MYLLAKCFIYFVMLIMLLIFVVGSMVLGGLVSPTIGFTFGCMAFVFGGVCCLFVMNRINL